MTLTARETGLDTNLATWLSGHPPGHLYGHLAHGTGLDIGLAMTSPIACDTGKTPSLSSTFTTTSLSLSNQQTYCLPLDQK